MSLLRILALDLAQSTGWARLDENGLTSGVLDFKLSDDENSETPGAFWCRVADTLRALAEPSALGRVGVVAWERIVPSPTSFRGGNSLSLLYGLQSRVVELAHRVGAAPLTVAPNTLKKHATGNGRSEKPAMVAAAGRRWPGVTIECHDHADALCVLAWALENSGHLPASVLR